MISAHEQELTEVNAALQDACERLARQLGERDAEIHRLRLQLTEAITGRSEAVRLLETAMDECKKAQEMVRELLEDSPVGATCNGLEVSQFIAPGQPLNGVL